MSETNNSSYYCSEAEEDLEVYQSDSEALSLSKRIHPDSAARLKMLSALEPKNFLVHESVQETSQPFSCKNEEQDPYDAQFKSNLEFTSLSNVNSLHFRHLKILKKLEFVSC